MRDYKYATIDIETTGLNRYKDKVTWIGIGLAESAEEDLDKIFVFNGQKESSVEKFLRLVNWMREHKVKTVLQNGKFDTLFLEQHYRVKIPIIEDVMLLVERWYTFGGKSFHCFGTKIEEIGGGEDG